MKKVIWVCALAGIVFLGMSTSRAGESQDNLFLKTVLPTFVYDFFFTAAELAEDRLILDMGIATAEADAAGQVRHQNWPLKRSDLNPFTEVQQRQNARRAVVLLNNRDETLPLRAGLAFRLITKGPTTDFETFKKFSGLYAPYQHLNWSGQATVAELRQADPDIPTVVLIDNDQSAAKGDNWWIALQDLASRMPIVLVHFGAPSHLQKADRSTSVVTVPLLDEITEQLMAQAIFGGLDLDGRTTNQINSFYPAGSGQYLAATRLQYALPEEVGMDSHALDQIEDIVAQAIRQRAMPGCQVLVAKDGKIIYEKGFGYHTYKPEHPVHPSDLYDLASVTKAAATTLGVMKLFDEGRLQLTGKLQDYLPDYRGGTVGHMSLLNLLSHHSGIQTNLPINRYLGRQKGIFSDSQSEEYPIEMGPGHFLSVQTMDEIRGKLPRVWVNRRPVYGYSDVNFVLLQQVVERLSSLTMDDYLHTEIYRKLGLRRFGFNPNGRYPADHLVPTAEDYFWRGGLLRGYVHDEGAAMLGGVAGHAGLFGDAADLATIFQMLLNNGTYGGQRFFNPATVNQFTSPNGLNYRGLGFDRLQGVYGSVVEAGASPATFGHTGFTGTCVWADPDNKLVYVFLANRIHPDVKNDKLIRLGIRERVHRQVYASLKSFQPAGV